MQVSAALEYAAEMSRHHGVALEDTNDVDQLFKRCAEFGLTRVETATFLITARDQCEKAEQRHAQWTSKYSQSYSPACSPPRAQHSSPSGYRLGLTWRSGHPGAYGVFTLTVTGKDD